MAKKRSGGKKWWKKPGVVIAVVAASVGVGALVWKFWLKDKMSMGLLDVQRKRLGIYIPEPTVKRFSSFTGTKYYS